MTDRLSALACERLEDLQAQVDGLTALGELARTLDPDRRLGRWRLAGIMAQHLERFEATGLVRILRGGRQPRGPGETAMSAILRADLPRSQKRICDLIS